MGDRYNKPEGEMFQAFEPSKQELQVPAEAYLVPNPPTPCDALVFDDELCTGCNSCVEVCRCDVLMPNTVSGKPPILVYPDECWFCGCCVAHCPRPGAIRLNHPLNQRIGWKRKETGEYFRIGMKNPPPPNLKPPVGGWGLPGLSRDSDDRKSPVAEE
ncbi:MAG: ferredoxin family protein [Thermoleophilia bacterium]|nr:ferredoxin family protein [Thermoleophilia bacterium]